MKEHFTADWAFGIVGAIENVVRTNFPQNLRDWPLLQAFNFEAFELPDKYLILLFRDKLSGIPAGPSKAETFPHSDHPTLPPRVEEIELWQFYLRDKFKLRPEDAPFLIPIRDSGKHGASEDFDLFSSEEQMFWSQQMHYVISRYQAHLQALRGPEPHPNVTNNFIGPNSRMNVNSYDYSVNTSNAGAGEIFDLLRAELDAIEDETIRAEVSKSIDEMEETQGSGGFVEKYKELVALTADHITAFGPFIPALSNLLS